MLWIFFVTYEFSREPFLRLFVFRFITERVRINIFLRKFQTIHYVLALRKLVGSKYRKQSSPSYINVLLRFSYTVLFELMKTVKLKTVYCFYQSAQTLVAAARAETGTFNEASLFGYLLLLSYMIRFVWLITVVIEFLHWAYC